MKRNRYLAGWDEERVPRVLERYDDKSGEEAAGPLWAGSKSDPRMFCHIQDDAFTEAFRRT